MKGFIAALVIQIIWVMSGCSVYYEWRYPTYYSEPGKRYAAAEGEETLKGRDAELTEYFSMEAPRGVWEVNRSFPGSISLKTDELRMPATPSVLVTASIYSGITSPTSMRSRKDGDPGHKRVDALEYALQNRSLKPLFEYDRKRRNKDLGFDVRQTPREVIQSSMAVAGLQCFRVNYHMARGPEEGEYAYRGGREYTANISCPIWVDGTVGRWRLTYHLMIYRNLADRLGFYIDEEKILEKLDSRVRNMMETLEFYIPVEQPKMNDLPGPRQVCYPSSVDCPGPDFRNGAG